jgi:hypothetical protein
MKPHHVAALTLQFLIVSVVVDGLVTSSSGGSQGEKPLAISAIS